MPRLTVPTLTGHLIALEPLRADMVDEIAAAGAGDRSTFGFTQVPGGPEAASEYVTGLLDDRDHGRAAPFVQRRLADGVVVGCTRYMSPAWPLGRVDPDEVEVGGTWLDASAQRTGINTEAKRLLFGHAFDVWRVQRIAICTDARNEQSRRAIERLGAGFEGVLRRHRRSARADDGDVLRDTAVYGVTIDDWPRVRARLESLAAR